MWTATVQSSEYTDDGRVRVVLIFSNQTRKFSTELYLSGSEPENYIATYIRDRIQSLDNLDAIIATVPKGANVAPAEEVVAAPQIVVTPPDKFATSIDKLTRIKQLVDLSIIEPTDPIYTQALSAAKKDFDPSLIQ